MVFHIFNNNREVQGTMSDLLVVKAKVKEFAKGMNVAGDFAEALSEKVAGLIKDAAQRAKDNGRATVKARDL